MKELLDRLYFDGVGKVGFAYLGDVLPNKLRHLPYGISLVYPLLNSVIDQINDTPTFNYFHHYRTVNANLDRLALITAEYIQRKGYNAYTIAASQSVKDETDKYTGIFQHKTVAAASGMGWIGKSGLLVTPEYGPRVRLATVLTDMKLEVSNIPQFPGCGNCMSCVNACPAMALTGNNYVSGADRSTVIDARACSEYMKRNFQHIGRGSVCGVCIKVCPFGRKDQSYTIRT